MPQKNRNQRGSWLVRGGWPLCSTRSAVEKVDKGAGGVASQHDGRSEPARTVQTTMTVSGIGAEPKGGLLLVGLGRQRELQGLAAVAARPWGPR